MIDLNYASVNKFLKMQKAFGDFESPKALCGAKRKFSTFAITSGVTSNLF